MSTPGFDGGDGFDKALDEVFHRGPSRKVRVPYFIGVRGVDDIRALALRAGLHARWPVSDHRAGSITVVVGQDPAPFTKVRRDSIVNLSVSFE